MGTKTNPIHLYMALGRHGSGETVGLIVLLLALMS
jgi:hypothetical protein